VLYNFGTGSSDGQNPSAPLIFDASGNLYGTTQNGGPYSGGTVFELSPDSDGIGCCREILVYSFGNGGDGKNPYAGVILDNSGNLYGTTYGGGANTLGTAYALSPNGQGGWVESGLYSFGNGTDGQNPAGGLSFDNSGNLYGTTYAGGISGNGTVFELSSESAGIGCCRERLVYSFGNGGDGKNPYAGVIFNSGHLYGTTAGGGSYGGGTVYGVMQPPSPVQFLTVVPCRVVDTRNPDGPFGGPAISGGAMRSFPLAQSGNPCNIPSNAVAYSLNVTIVPQEHTLGYLTIWPTGETQPTVSTLNSPDGRVKANAAIVPAGSPAGSVSVYVTNTTDVILDIDGYFTAPGSQTLQFYPLTPCRVVDTRGANGDLGGPYLNAQMERDFPVLESSCIPTGLNIAAYSMNFTVVPHPAGQPLGYLTVWPRGETQPTVSTLNNPTATVVANAAIVPAGSGGGIATYAFNNTDLVIDINGYFAVPGADGYSFYPVTPCRAFDSRSNNGQPFTGQIVVSIAGSPCAPPSTAGGYVFNATVVPSASLGYLTLWPDGETQPVVSTLNAYDGFTTSDLAIVPNMDGSVDAFAGQGNPGPQSGYTQLILDISGYFAP
jgi:uncharacterized repeat protein (TIGR03803 family)